MSFYAAIAAIGWRQDSNIMNLGAESCVSVCVCVVTDGLVYFFFFFLFFWLEVLNG
jgi:hypothetical protein